MHDDQSYIDDIPSIEMDDLQQLNHWQENWFNSKLETVAIYRLLVELFNNNK